MKGKVQKKRNYESKCCCAGFSGLPFPLALGLSCHYEQDACSKGIREDIASLHNN